MDSYNSLIFHKCNIKSNVCWALQSYSSYTFPESQFTTLNNIPYRFARWYKQPPQEDVNHRQSRTVCSLLTCNWSSEIALKSKSSLCLSSMDYSPATAHSHQRWLFFLNEEARPCSLQPPPPGACAGGRGFTEGLERKVAVGTRRWWWL